MSQPTSGEPVNESSLKRSSVDQAVADLARSIGMTLTAPLRQADLVDDLRDQ